MHESEVLNKIFISYAHKDFDIVKGYVRYLKERYFNFWYDKNLVAGDRWRNEIGDQINASEYFIAFDSSNYRASEFCNKEYQIAEAGKKIIVCIKIENGFRDEFSNTGVSGVQHVYAVGKRVEEAFAEVERALPAIASCKKNKELLEKFHLDEDAPSKGRIGQFLNSRHYDLPLLFSYAFAFLRSCKLQSSIEYFNFDDIEVYPVKASKTLFFKFNAGERCAENDVGSNISKLIHRLLRDDNGEVYKSFRENESNHGYIIKKLCSKEYQSLSVDEMYQYFSDLKDSLGYLDENGASYRGNYRLNDFTLEQLQDKILAQVEDVCEGKIVFPQLKNIRTGDLFPPSEEEEDRSNINPLLQIVNDYDEKETSGVSKDIYVYGELGAGKIYLIKDFLQAYKKGVLFINLSRTKIDDESPSIIHDVVKNSNYKSGGFNLDVNSLIDYVLERPLTIVLYGLESLGEEKLRNVVEEIKTFSYYARIVVLSRKRNLVSKIFLSNTKDELENFEYFDVEPYRKEKVRASLEGIVKEELEDEKMLTLLDTPSKVRYFIALINGGKEEELRRKINNSGDLLFCYLFAPNFNSVSTQCKNKIRKDITEPYFLDMFDENIDRMFSSIAQWAYYKFIGEELEIDEHSFNYLEYFNIMKQGAEGYQFAREEYGEYFIAYHLANTLVRMTKEKDENYGRLLASLKHFKNKYSILQFVGYYLSSERCESKVYSYLLTIARTGVETNLLATTVYLMLLLSDGLSSSDVDFDNLLTYIEEDTFRDTGLFKKIVVPNSVKRIERAAFVNLTGLKSIELGNGVETVAPWAIINCPDLKTIKIGKGLREITSPMLTSCDSLTSIEVKKSNPYFADRECYAQGLVSKDLTTFYFACSGLSTIDIPQTVTTIGSWAFKGMKKLKTLHIPASVTEIETDFTDECPNLTEFTVAAENATYSVLDGCMLTCKTASGKTCLFRLASGVEGAFVLPRSIERIGTDSISTCRKLTSIYVPDSVSEIGSYALADLENTRTIEFEDIDCLEKTGNFILMCHNKDLIVKTDGDILRPNNFTLTTRRNTDNEFKSDKLAFCADESFDALIRRREDIETYYGPPACPSGFSEIEIYRYVDLYRNKTSIDNDYNVLLMGMVEYNYFVGDGDRYKSMLQEIKDILKKLSINCIIITRDLPCPRELLEACKENGVSIYRSKRGTSAIPQIINTICKEMH